MMIISRIIIYVPTLPTALLRINARLPHNRPPPECSLKPSMYISFALKRSGIPSVICAIIPIPIKTIAANTTFCIALGLYSLTYRKKAETKTTAGTIYCTVPNNPKKKLLTIVTPPHRPKLASSNISIIAPIAHTAISPPNDISSSASSICFTAFVLSFTSSLLLLDDGFLLEELLFDLFPDLPAALPFVLLPVFAA